MPDKPSSNAARTPRIRSAKNARTSGLPSKGFYLMESPREAERLEAKTDSTMAEQQLRWAGLVSGMRAVEVGCGSGAVTRVMARLAFPAHTTGIDQSRARLAEARRLAARDEMKIEFKQGDAFHLPLPSRSFAFVWSRFLLQYLPHPERAFAELVRITCPGGIVTVADLDGQIEQFHPLDPSLRADLEEGLRLIGETGFDPKLGRKLYYLFHKAGLREVSVNVTPYQVYAGALGEQDLMNWRRKAETVTAHLIQRTGDRSRWERFRDRFIDRLLSSDLFYYCTMIQVRGCVPKGQGERGA
jgi:ubiquinone/menaquinone biosynthesis C-methylase UbiE